MRKIFKENKGFSLVELLVAILIMAVIAGTAISLFGGVLSSSREGADTETSESIKRAILTYMNMTNDVDLDAIGIIGDSDPEDLLNKLCCTIKIEPGTTTGKKTTFTAPDVGRITTNPTALDNVGDTSDINGTYGPFLDATKEFTPKTPGAKGWHILIDSDTQVISVKVSETVNKIEFK